MNYASDGHSPQVVSVVLASRILMQYPNSIAGSGLPILASLLASKLERRHITIFDSGSISPQLVPCPISVSDGAVDYSFTGPASTVLAGGLQSGKVHSSVLGAAQIDARGRINSTWLKVASGMRRLPGAGGAPAMASFSQVVVVLTSHLASRFPMICDYVSSDPASTSSGPHGDREYLVVTEKCVLRWSFISQEFVLDTLVRGCSMDEISSVVVHAKVGHGVNLVYRPSQIEIDALLGIIGPEGSNWNVAGRVSNRLTWGCR